MCLRSSSSFCPDRLQFNSASIFDAFPFLSSLIPSLPVCCLSLPFDTLPPPSSRQINTQSAPSLFLLSFQPGSSIACFLLSSGPSPMTRICICLLRQHQFSFSAISALFSRFPSAHREAISPPEPNNWYRGWRLRVAPFDRPPPEARPPLFGRPDK